jgi:hypothetical protein
LKTYTRPAKAVALALVIILPLLFTLLNSLFSQPQAASAAVNGFVTRSGNKLLLNGQPFRMAGANIHWLGLDDSTGTVDYPSEYRVADALITAKEMGVNVVRSHTLGFSSGCAKCILPSLGVYNEQALRRVDYAIKTANELGLRLMLPLTDNYRYYHGGKFNFTDWRGVGEEDFYYNRTVVADFKQYINTLLNRVNTYTGVAYKNDPTIMAWETGNEVISPAEWTGEIARHLKSVAPQQLVVDGKYWINRGVFGYPEVDIVNDHLYPMDIARLQESARDSAAAGKVYIIGEYDWVNERGGPPLTDFLNAIENNAVGGDFFWTIYGHKDIHGYATHGENYAMYYPGKDAEQRTRAQLLRSHLYRMSYRGVAAHGLPAAPKIIQADTSGIITWEGSPFADKYSVERSTTSASGPWTVICDRCVDDRGVPWRDANRPAGNTWYRVRAHNLEGTPGAYTPVYALRSNLTTNATPATTKVDDMNSLNNLLGAVGVSLEIGDTNFFEGDSGRLRRNGTTAQEITWQHNNTVSFEAVTYHWTGEAAQHFSFMVSSDNANWRSVTPVISAGFGEWKKFVYTLNGLSGVNYVKMRWAAGGQFWNPQIAKVSLMASAGGTVPQPTATAVPPTNTPVSQPTSTPVPPTATPTQPTGSTTIVDDLNDLSKTHSRTNVGIDNNNSEFLGGDPARVRRNGTSSEEIAWRLNGMSSFVMESYFWPGEAVQPFTLFTSGDGNNWQQVNAAITGGTGDWKKFIYTIHNLSNVNYVKVRWAAGGQFWNPQIGKVTMTAGASQPQPTATSQPQPTATAVPPTSTPRPTNTPVPPTATPRPTSTPVPPTATPQPPVTSVTTVDDLNDFSKTHSRTNISLEGNNSEFLHGDTSRARRNGTNSEEIVWKQNNLKSFVMDAYFWPNESVQHFTLLVSADGNNWQQVNAAITGGTGDWKKFTYTLSNLSNVNYVKVRWASGGQFWNYQIGKVTLVS